MLCVNKVVNLVLLYLIRKFENPEDVFKSALQNGATQIFPVKLEHGWKLGKLTDPFGFTWAIGHPVE